MSDYEWSTSTVPSDFNKSDSCDSHSYEHTVSEAADAALAKSAKLDVAARAVRVGDEKAYLDNDREYLHRFRKRSEAQQIGADVKAALNKQEDEDGAGDVVVCDDVNHTVNHYHEPKQPELPKTSNGIRGLLSGAALATALLGSGAGGGLGIAALMGAFQRQPANPVVEKQVWRGKLGIGYSQDGELEVDLDGKPVRVEP